MYNYSSIALISDELSEILSAVPVTEATMYKKALYNDLNMDNMFGVRESQLDENTGKLQVVDRLYNDIVSKRNIDMGNIPLSKGDITRLKQYDTIKLSMDYILKYDEMYHISINLGKVLPSKGTQDIGRMTRIHEILTVYKNDFKFGFTANNAIIMHAYCVLVAALIDLILINMVTITNVIEDSNPSTLTKIKINNEKLTSIRAVDKIIASFDNGTWAKYMMGAKKSIGKAVSGWAVLAWTAVGIVGLISLLYAIRALITLYYESAVSINEKCKYMSDYIEEFSQIENDPVAKEKQVKMTNKLRNISGFISAKILKEDKRAKDDINQSNVQLFDKDSSGNPTFTNPEIGDIVFEG